MDADKAVNKAPGQQQIKRRRYDTSFLVKGFTKFIRISIGIAVAYYFVTILLCEFVRSHCYDQMFLTVGKALAEQLPKTIDTSTTHDEGYDYDLINESWAAHPETSDWYDQIAVRQHRGLTLTNALTGPI